MFYFRRATVFCLGCLLSKHKMTGYSKKLGEISPCYAQCVASKKFGGQVFDFKRIALFCSEKRLSKHKMTICSKNSRCGPFAPPLATPMGVNRFKSVSRVKDWFDCVNFVQMFVWAAMCKTESPQNYENSAGPWQADLSTAQQRTDQLQSILIGSNQSIFLSVSLL